MEGEEVTGLILVFVLGVLLIIAATIMDRDRKGLCDTCKEEAELSRCTKCGKWLCKDCDWGRCS